MPEKSKRGGKRKGAGRKSKAAQLLQAGFVANWFTNDFQAIKWKSLVNSEDQRIVIDAMKYLTDRLHGKPKQEVEQHGPNGGAIPVEIICDIDEDL